jgi:hypothetical protein
MKVMEFQKECCKEIQGLGRKERAIGVADG